MAEKFLLKAIDVTTKRKVSETICKGIQKSKITEYKNNKIQKIQKKYKKNNNNIK